MKKIATILTALAILAGNGGYAQTQKSAPAPAPMGSGSQAGTYSSYDDFAWGIGAGALIIIAVVAGVTVGGALGGASSQSH